MSDREFLSHRLESGLPVILPTETVYGIFAKALSEDAVDLVYTLKDRPREKAMNLNVSTFEEILNFSKNQPDYLKKLYDAFLPGPLTVILEANNQVPNWINSGLKSVGFRLPSHPMTRALIATHGPLIGPSANKSGQESGKYYKDIFATFDGQVPGYEDDAFLEGIDSTIIDLSGEKARILRRGEISKETILAVVPEIPFD